MNTPRQLLLARHQAVTPRLDTLRSQVVADAFPTRSSQPTAASTFQLLWHQLFWTSRRAWLVLATLWTLILILQFATLRHHTTSLANTPTTLFSQTLQEQLRIRAELLDLPKAAPTRPPATAPTPVPAPHRSEIPRHLPVA